MCPPLPKTPLLGLVNQFLRIHSGTFGSDFMLQMVSGVLIYFTFNYLLFTVSSVGKFLPMSSNKRKKRLCSGVFVLFFF